MGDALEESHTVGTMNDPKVAAELLHREWLYRHQLYWKLLFSFGFAVLFVNSIPYLKDEIRTEFGLGAWIFPIGSMFLTLAVGWLLYAEVTRATAVRNAIEARLKDYWPQKVKVWPWRGKIGVVATLIFVISLLSISLANALHLKSSSGVVGHGPATSNDKQLD